MAAVLDLTSLPPQVAYAILQGLPKPDVNATEWVVMEGEHAYTATTFHVIAGVKVTVHTVAEFSELAGDDWRFVNGLSFDDWADYQNSTREAA
jgi:hypothetical protein